MDGNVKKRIVEKKNIREKEKEEGMDTLKVNMRLMLRKRM